MITFEDIADNPSIVEEQEVYLYLLRDEYYTPRVERYRITNVIQTRKSVDLSQSFSFAMEGQDGIEYEETVFCYNGYARDMDGEMEAFVDLNTLIEGVNKRKAWWDQVHEETHAEIAKFFED